MAILLCLSPTLHSFVCPALLFIASLFISTKERKEYCRRGRRRAGLLCSRFGVLQQGRRRRARAGLLCWCPQGRRRTGVFISLRRTGVQVSGVCACAALARLSLWPVYLRSLACLCLSTNTKDFASSAQRIPALLLLSKNRMAINRKERRRP